MSVPVSASKATPAKTFVLSTFSSLRFALFVEYGTLVDVEALNVRAGAGTNYSILGTIRKGTTVEVLEQCCATGSGYIWHKILYNGYSKQC